MSRPGLLWSVALVWALGCAGEPATQAVVSRLSSRVTRVVVEVDAQPGAEPAFGEVIAGRRAWSIVAANLGRLFPGRQIVMPESPADVGALPVQSGAERVWTDQELGALGRRTRDTPRAILRAMREEKVRRLITISASPAGPDEQKSFLMPYIVEPVLYHFFGAAYADMRRMESLLATSDLDWTVVRPPRLTDASATGKYRTAVDAPVPRTRSISRADLATAVLAAVPDPELHRRVLSVSY